MKYAQLWKAHLAAWLWMNIDICNTDKTFTYFPTLWLTLCDKSCRQADNISNFQHSGRCSTAASLSVKVGDSHATQKRKSRSTYSHISVVNERPAAGSFQRIVKEILQSAITRVSFVSDAGPRSAQNAAPFCALGTGDKKCPVSARLRSPGVQSHKADFQFLLPCRRVINFTVGGFFHHPYSLADPNECIK